MAAVLVVMHVSVRCVMMMVSLFLFFSLCLSPSLSVSLSVSPSPSVLAPFGRAVAQPTTIKPDLRPASLSGPAHPSSRALSGRLKLTVRRHKFNHYSFSLGENIRRL